MERTDSGFCSFEIHCSTWIWLYHHHCCWCCTQFHITHEYKRDKCEVVKAGPNTTPLYWWVTSVNVYISNHTIPIWSHEWYHMHQWILKALKTIHNLVHKHHKHTLAFMWGGRKRTCPNEYKIHFDTFYTTNKHDNISHSLDIFRYVSLCDAFSWIVTVWATLLVIIFEYEQRILLHVFFLQPNQSRRERARW